MKTFIKKNLYFKNALIGEYEAGIYHGGNRHFGGTAVYGAGWVPPYQDNIGYYKIGIISNSVDFGGELTQPRYNHCSGVTNGVRAVITHGNSPSSPSSTLDYFTIANVGGTAMDFGLCNSGTTEQGGNSGCGRGITAGGGNPATDHREYITIGTTSNGTDWGELAGARRHATGSISDGIHYLFAGGQISNQNMICKGTFGSSATSSDFGNLDGSRAGASGMSNNYRGVYGGGESNDHMQYVTIETGSDAIDFGGELTRGTWGSPGTSDGARGVTQGDSGVLDYINIGTKGHAADFGEMFQTVTSFGATQGN